MSPLTDTSVIFKKLDWKPPSDAEHGRSRSRRPAEPSDPDPPRPAGPRPTSAAAPHAAGMGGSLSRSFSPSSSSSSSSSPSSSAAGGAALPCSCSSSAPGDRPAAAAGGLCSDMAPLPSRQPSSACRHPDPAPLAPAAEEPRWHPRRRRSAVMQQRSCSRAPGHPRTAGRSAALPPSPRPGEGGGQCGTERRGGGRTRCPGAVKLHRRATYSPWAGGGAAAGAAMLFIGAS